MTDALNFNSPLHLSFATLVVTCSLLAVVGCDSTSASKVDQARGATAASDSGPHIGVMCIGDRIDNPPEPFHYSYRYVDASGSVDKEADITPETMGVTITDKTGSHSYRGVHSDEASWNSAVLDLSGLNLTRMSATLDSVSDRFRSAVKPEGPETVNGYETTKYTIDTANANSSDRQKFEVFGKGSFEKGMVWIPADGCAVKLVLDEGLSQSDGSVKNDHFEIARIKK